MINGPFSSIFHSHVKSRGGIFLAEMRKNSPLAGLISSGKPTHFWLQTGLLPHQWTRTHSHEDPLWSGGDRVVVVTWLQRSHFFLAQQLEENPQLPHSPFSPISQVESQCEIGMCLLFFPNHP